MRVCYANPTIVLKRPVAAVAERMAAKHTVSLLTPRLVGKQRDRSTYYAQPNKVSVIEYPAVRLPLLWDWPLPLPEFFSKSWHAFKDNAAVHAWVPFYWSTLWLAFLKLFFFRKKKFVLTMDTIPGYSFSMGTFMDFIFKIYYSTLGQIVFAAADSITLYGESFREHAIRAGIPSRKICITPTGIDRVHLHGKDVRKELGMRANEILVLYVGLTVPRKGVDILIEVAEKLKEKGFVFVVVGDGPKRKEYAKRAKEKSLRVIFTSTRDDVHRFYARADIFLFPSRGEGLAGVLMEAMLHHVPIVASDITGNRDLIKNNKTGVLCKPEDARAFARAIETLSRSRTERKKLASAAYDHLRDFSWSKRLHAFEEVLR